MKRRRPTELLLLAFGIIAVVGVSFRASHENARRLAQQGARAKEIQAAIHHVPAYTNVKVFVGSNFRFAIRGSVPSEADCDALVELVGATLTGEEMRRTEINVTAEHASGTLRR